jgi:hypothetical protein
MVCNTSTDDEEEERKVGGSQADFVSPGAGLADLWVSLANVCSCRGNIRSLQPLVNYGHCPASQSRIVDASLAHQLLPP